MNRCQFYLLFYSTWWFCLFLFVFYHKSLSDLTIWHSCIKKHSLKEDSSLAHLALLFSNLLFFSLELESWWLCPFSFVFNHESMSFLPFNLLFYSTWWFCPFSFVFNHELIYDLKTLSRLILSMNSCNIFGILSWNKTCNCNCFIRESL